MSVDRRAEATMGLEEVIAAQGYAIVPLSMKKLPYDSDAAWAWTAAAEKSLREKRYEYIFLGWLRPFQQDPFRPQHEYRFGAHLIYDPNVMKIRWANVLKGEDVRNISEGLREEGYVVVNTRLEELEGKIVLGLARKSVDPVTQEASEGLSLQG